MRPFRLFVGGPIGSGRQYISWIHRLDWIEIVRWIVSTPAVTGPVNATAPHPVTNREFARALGRAMRRPSLLPAPGFAVRLALGEFADSILTGQRVLPARAQKESYHFRYPEIDRAFQGAGFRFFVLGSGSSFWVQVLRSGFRFHVPGSGPGSRFRSRVERAPGMEMRGGTKNQEPKRRTWNRNLEPGT